MQTLMDLQTLMGKSELFLAHSAEENNPGMLAFWSGLPATHYNSVREVLVST